MFVVSQSIEAAADGASSSAAKSAFAAIAAGAKAFPPIGSASRQARLGRLTETGAWTEAALALLELELPDWHVRRLEQDGDEWHCTLSLHRQTPLEFDDAVDGRDPLLPLAILDALVEARRRSNPSPPSPSSSGSQNVRTEAAWVDNIF
ncbi:MAG: hypothetical protein HY834_04335 [Devosia nanyangense]|uniref:Uncharacterized protein n=1 Tax=Devosia nanyangense TaxID=1228055 RepID=A0A933KZ15_9HYPH|nr:hypothetical protein [Devosia nanyangense]